MDSKCIVYVVDDDLSVRKSLCWLLESANYQTKSFGSAQEFLSGYDPQSLSCLLLDMHMPNATGLQLQSLLDAKCISVPIIFISGHVDVRSASEAFRAGACDVLMKPVDVDLLLKRVCEALEKDRQRQRTAGKAAVRQQQFAKLTPEEREVFQELLKGRTTEQLATCFDMTCQTAAKHRASILEKLSIDTDAQLIESFQDFASP